MENSREWKIIIKALVDKGFDITGLTLESYFTDIGLDSLDVFSVVVSIEQEYSIKFKDEEWVKIKNISDVIKLLKEHLK